MHLQNSILPKRLSIPFAPLSADIHPKRRVQPMLPSTENNRLTVLAVCSKASAIFLWASTISSTRLSNLVSSLRHRESLKRKISSSLYFKNTPEQCKHTKKKIKQEKKKEKKNKKSHILTINIYRYRESTCCPGHVLKLSRSFSCSVVATALAACEQWTSSSTSTSAAEPKQIIYTLDGSSIFPLNSDSKPEPEGNTKVLSGHLHILDRTTILIYIYINFMSRW